MRGEVAVLRVESCGFQGRVQRGKVVFVGRGGGVEVGTRGDVGEGEFSDVVVGFR